MQNKNISQIFFNPLLMVVICSWNIYYLEKFKAACLRNNKTRPAGIVTLNNTEHKTPLAGTAEIHTFPSCSILRWQSISWLWRSHFSSFRSFRRCLSVSCRDVFPLISNIHNKEATQYKGVVPLMSNYKSICTRITLFCLLGSNNNRIVNAENMSTNMD